MRDPRPLDDDIAVNRIWNEIAGGLLDASASQTVDTPIIETLRRLHALGAAPPPASSRERVRRGLQAHRPPQHDDEEFTLTALSAPWPTHPNGLPRDVSLPAPRAGVDLIRTLPRRVSSLAAAALLLGIIGVIVLTALIASREPGPPVDQPLIHAPASPSPAATPEDAILLDIDIPAAAIPPADGRISGLSYDVLPPGHTSEFTWYSESYGFGPRVQYVVSGSFTATVSGPVQLVRADGTIEEIAPDTAVTVSAGEALVSRNEYAVATTNPGAEPTEYLDWGLISSPNAMYAGRGEVGVEGRDLDVTGNVPELPGSIALTIRRAVLAPDDYVPTTGAGLVQEVTGDPEVDVVKRFNEEGIWPIESKGAMTVIYVVTMFPLNS